MHPFTIITITFATIAAAAPLNRKLRRRFTTALLMCIDYVDRAAVEETVAWPDYRREAAEENVAWPDYKREAVEENVAWPDYKREAAEEMVAWPDY